MGSAQPENSRLSTNTIGANARVNFRVYGIAKMLNFAHGDAFNKYFLCYFFMRGTGKFGLALLCPSGFRQGEIPVGGIDTIPVI